MFIDTYVVIKRLMEVGIQEKAAEVFVDTVQKITAASYENLSTKQDVIDCRKETEMKMAEFKADTDKEFAAVRTEIAEFRASTDKEFVAVRAEISGLRNDIEKLSLNLTIRMGSMLAASVLLVTALQKLL